MSKLTKIIGLTILMGFNICASAQSWQLYDNFNSGVLNTNKWDVFNVDQNAQVQGTVTVVNNRMRIVHYPVPSPSEDQYIYIGLKQFRSAIKGIRADIKVHSCTGNQEARLETNYGYVDKTGSNFNVLTAQSSVRPHQNVIAGITYIDEYKPNGDYVDYVKDESWNGMYDTGQLADRFKIVSVQVSPNTMKSVYWYVAGANQSVRHMPKKVNALPFALKRNYISTRRREDVGHSADNCTIEIDNVMVLR